MQKVTVYEYVKHTGINTALYGYSLKQDCKKHIFGLSRFTGKRDKRYIANYLGIPVSWLTVVRSKEKNK